MNIEVTVETAPPIDVTVEFIAGPPGRPGDKGDKGDRGEIGVGIKGDKGDPGNDGNDGADGADGAQGIQGIQGIPGVKGDKGDTGAPGAPGGSGGGGVQHVPPVGSSVMSSYFLNSTTASLRGAPTAPMPLCFMGALSIDQVSFNLTVMSANAGQTVKADLVELIGHTWTLVQNLATGMPIGDAIGVKTATFAPVALTAGVIYGIKLTEEQAFDSVVRVTSGTMTGPGIGTASGFGTGSTLPLGANVAITTAVPYVRVRRSS